MVVLMTNPPSGSLNALAFTVRGLFTTVSKAYDDSALRIPLPMTQKLPVSYTHLDVYKRQHYCCDLRPSTGRRV